MKETAKPEMVQLIAQITGQEGIPLETVIVDIPKDVYEEGEAREYCDAHNLVDLGSMEGYTLLDADDAESLIQDLNEDLKLIKQPIPSTPYQSVRVCVDDIMALIREFHARTGIELPLRDPEFRVAVLKEALRQAEEDL